LNNYKKDLSIDIHNLDEECIKQPFLYEMYAQKLPPLYKFRDELKFEIDTTKAKLDGVIREGYAAKGVKTTEGKIQNEIVSNPQVIDLEIKYINICAEIKEHEAIRDAFQQKRDMLKLLTEQYIAGYWSSIEPKVLKENRVDALKNKLTEKMLEEKTNKGGK